MREIKFRAWDNQNNRMLFAGFHDRNWYSSNDLAICSRLPSNSSTMTLMQYTGLTDKNGKEIYEGDIYEAEYAGSSCGIYRNKIYWKCDGWWFANAPMNCWEHGEVIGNIYENPELLNDS